MYPKFEEVQDALKVEEFDVELHRTELLKNTWFHIVANIVLIILAVIFLVDIWWLSLLLLGILIYSMIVRQRRKQAGIIAYAEHYRKHVVLPVIQAVETCYGRTKMPLTARYVPEEKLYDEMIFSSSLWRYKGCTVEGSDFLSGTMALSDLQQPIYFKSSMVQLFDESSGNEDVHKDATLLEVFSGTVLVIDLPFACNGQHRLLSGTFSTTSWGMMMQQQMSKWSYKQLVKYDDQLNALDRLDVGHDFFQDHWRVHSNDEAEINMLLNEALQQTLAQIRADFPTRQMDMYIQGQHVYVAIKGNRYVMEERMHLQIEDRQLESIYKGIMMPLRIVEAFATRVQQLVPLDKEADV